MDCANGIGAPKLKEFAKLHPKLSVQVVNDRVGEQGVLNFKVCYDVSHLCFLFILKNYTLIVRRRLCQSGPEVPRRAER